MTGKISFSLPVSSPVEVRNKKMQLIARGMTSDELEVESGHYFVQAKLPSDETLIEGVHVETGQTSRVDFAAYDIEETFRASAETVRGVQTERIVRHPAAGQPFKIRRSATAPWKIRFSKFGSWELEPADELEIEDSETDAFGMTTLTIHNRNTEVVFASVASEGTVPINVALPAVGIMDAQRCKLMVTTTEQGPLARAFPTDSAIENPARYLADGDLRSAAQYLTPRYAESLLQGKMMDPLAAALGGYILLLQGETERMHDWSANLANWFSFMSDGSVIDGERLALLGHHEEAFDRFMELRDRGLPIFTDGFSLALSRLRHYLGAGGKRAGTRATTEARALVDKIDHWALYADFGALTSTLRTSDLGDPTSDAGQSPADLAAPDWLSL